MSSKALLAILIALGSAAGIGLEARSRRGAPRPATEAPAPLSIAVGPGGRLYAAFRGRVLASEDGGETWTGIGACGGPPIDHVEPDPASAATLYASGLSSLYRSHDSGRAWAKVHEAEGVIAFLRASPTSPVTVYAAFSSRGVPGDSSPGRLLESRDGGETFRPAGLEGGDVELLAFSPEDPERLYVQVLREGSESGSGLFRRLGPKGGWRKIAGYSGFSVLAAHGGGILTAERFGVLWESRDDGESWKRRSAVR